MVAIEERAPPRGLATAALFTATIFLSASLLFFVQPLYSKLVLPVLGGAPAVWTTAMLFFQTVLIGGYLYAHLLTRHVPAGMQVALHLGLWAAALTFLPLAVPEEAAWQAGLPAAPQTLWLFALGVGVPFFCLSANAPLLQAWYARSGAPSAGDPYFLYGASNLGSLLALLAFPLLAEPLFGASAIGRGFAAGFVALGLGLLVSGLAARGACAETTVVRRTGARPAWRGQLHWGFLAFVPSSLMLAVTTKIGTDMGAIPLIWVIPLALYLLSFVVTFRAALPVPPRVLRLASYAALAWLGLVFSGHAGDHLTIWHGAGMIAAFFVLAVLAHRRLYEARPGSGELTRFYLVMSLGGAAGGLFNSILAPLLFDTLIEGALTTLAAAFLVVSPALRPNRRDLLAGAAWAGLAVAVLVLLAARSGLGDRSLVALMLALALAPALFWRHRIARVAVAGLLVVTVGKAQLAGDVIFADRSFFGTHRVVDSGDHRLYVNGSTIHGAARRAEIAAGVRPTPLTYYHPAGPLAEAVRRAPADARVGVVGLGVGALACHARAGQSWRFYEIDPVVDRVARDATLFPFVTRCTPEAPTRLGDARMVLARETGPRHDLLIIDAYSSNAVPMHLTTLEAVGVYLDRLAPEGVLIFHISNRYFDLAPPLARAAEALGLAARLRRHPGGSAGDAGDFATDALAMSRDAGALAHLTPQAGWHDLRGDGGAVWTDDRANLLSALK